MKTAENWSRNVEFDIGTKSGILRSEFIRVIKQIQLDAWKQGMMDAAELCDNRKSNIPMVVMDTAILCRDDIFAAIQNKKEL